MLMQLAKMDVTWFFFWGMKFFKIVIFPKCLKCDSKANLKMHITIKENMKQQQRFVICTFFKSAQVASVNCIHMSQIYD